MEEVCGLPNQTNIHRNLLKIGGFRLIRSRSPVRIFNINLPDHADNPNSNAIWRPYCFKGELNLYNKWQSDDLFHIVINENHPRGNRF